MHGDFVPNVSVIDLIFNQGPEAKQYFKRFSS
ncbi:MAG: WbqC family protein [Cyclobacteriaceae bacterium]